MVKSIPALLEDVEHGRSASYGRFLTFVHRWDAFDEEIRRPSAAAAPSGERQAEHGDQRAVRIYSGAEDAPAGGLPLTGEIFDALVQQYAPTGILGGYALQEGLPVITITVERRRGGVQVEGIPALTACRALTTITFTARRPSGGCSGPAAPILPALQALGGKSRSSPVLTPRPSAAMCCRSWAASSTLWTRNACC